MGQLMDDHIVQHLFRGKDEPPVEVEVPLAAAASPAGLLFADGDTPVGHAHNAGIIFGLAGENVPRDLIYRARSFAVRAGCPEAAGSLFRFSARAR